MVQRGTKRAEQPLGWAAEPALSGWLAYSPTAVLLSCLTTARIMSGSCPYLCLTAVRIYARSKETRWNSYFAHRFCCFRREIHARSTEMSQNLYFAQICADVYRCIYVRMHICVDACVMYTGTCIGRRGVVAWHRRRKIRSPAATDQALRGARPKGSPRAWLLPKLLHGMDKGKSLLGNETP